jgi:hypothetical protein
VRPSFYCCTFGPLLIALQWWCGIHGRDDLLVFIGGFFCSALLMFCISMEYGHCVHSSMRRSTDAQELASRGRVEISDLLWRVRNGVHHGWFYEFRHSSSCTYITDCVLYQMYNSNITYTTDCS